MEKYIIQKTQKIVSALYLTTDFIKDSDAIKWEIREEGIATVSHAMMFSADVIIDKVHATHLIMSSLEKILTLLYISSMSSLISKMNSDIMIREVKSLLEYVSRESRENHLPGYILADTFFATDSKENIKDINKGQTESLKTLSIGQNNTEINQSLRIERKSLRKDSIIDLLKKDSNLTIKDFTRVIKDCSEKTIQRELISLVKEGLVMRVGERRWSTYSLKNH